MNKRLKTVLLLAIFAAASLASAGKPGIMVGDRAPGILMGDRAPGVMFGD